MSNTEEITLQTDKTGKFVTTCFGVPAKFYKTIVEDGFFLSYVLEETPEDRNANASNEPFRLVAGVRYNVGYSMRGHNRMESYVEGTNSSVDYSDIFYTNEENRLIFVGEHGILFHVVQEYEDFADTWALASSNIYYESNSQLEYITFTGASEYLLK